MNWDVVEPVLTELLEDTKWIKKELLENRRALESLRQKMEDQIKKAEAKGEPAPALDATSLKLFLGSELQKIRMQLQEMTPKEHTAKPWDILSSDNRSRNFKLVFESVCKWTGILVSGLYLLHAILSHWK